MADMAAVEDKVHDKASRGRGGNRRGGRSGGGGQSREVQVSKALSKLLRHQAENAGISLDGEGYAPLSKVLNWGPLKSLKVTFEDVKSVVASNEKQRFSLKSTGAEDSINVADWLIRANQGHSIKVDAASLLVPLTEANLPPRVFHGTYFAFWPVIVETGGLKPMSRNHVHCSSGTPEEGVTSGMRKDAELLIEVDVKASLDAGEKWWLSDNGVILSDGGDSGMVSTKYFKNVTGRKVDVGTLWKDGEKVADLPAGIKAVVPQGKGPRGNRVRGPKPSS
ncbi:hypothetical protein Golomagni_06276 [Golovinomyces magnicellulatus]|nr:hypothetical protein Golomagni_06276 [Golovinomyces magnicellulatus]